MKKFSCTKISGGEDFIFATLIAEDEAAAREMAVAETNKKWPGQGGRPRHWTVAVLETEAEGPAQLIDCDRREA